MEPEPRPSLRPNLALMLIAFTLLFGVLLAGARKLQGDHSPLWKVSGNGLEQGGEAAPLAAAQPILVQPTRGPRYTPTPDAPHPIPAPRNEPVQYVVQPGDALGVIAGRYGVSLEQIIEANQLANPDHLEVGQLLSIPAPQPEGSAPGFKILPDSELVLGPQAAQFDLQGFVASQGGYLARFQGEAEGMKLSGAQIVEKVAHDYSVNPRLLLAVLEYQSGWVTQATPRTREAPIGELGPRAKDLYIQLAWTANNLNRGYYLWRVNGATNWVLSDGSVAPVNPTINAGTAGVQALFAPLYDRAGWEKAVSSEGLFKTYEALFGYPFDYAVEPLLEPNLQQPRMQLPFEKGRLWSYTGGPHGGWADGSAWAALDFAPPSEVLGCVQSEEWVTAVADGDILRTGNGAVIQELDGDGNEGTGWVVLYMHIESRDRIQPGTSVKAGERIGHPSCEGGVSDGTHVHLARRYNGEWIAADQADMAFNLDGWVSSGTGVEYDGYLAQGGQTVEAYAGRSDINQITR